MATTQNSEFRIQNPEDIIDISGLRVYFPIHGGILLRKVGEIKAVDGVSLKIKKETPIINSKLKSVRHLPMRSLIFSKYSSIVEIYLLNISF